MWPSDDCGSASPGWHSQNTRNIGTLKPPLCVPSKDLKNDSGNIPIPWLTLGLQTSRPEHLNRNGKRHPTKYRSLGVFRNLGAECPSGSHTGSFPGGRQGGTSHECREDVRKRSPPELAREEADISPADASPSGRFARGRFALGSESH